MVGGRRPGVDAVVDCTSSHDERVFLQSIDVLKRRGGTIVTQTYTLTNFSLGRLADKYVTLRQCRGHSYASVAIALDWIASGRYALGELLTHRYPLRQADVAGARELLAGDGRGVEIGGIGLAPPEEPLAGQPGQRRHHRGIRDGAAPLQAANAAATSFSFVEK